MAQATGRRRTTISLEKWQATLSEIQLMLFLVSGVFLLVALVSFDPADSGWSYATGGDAVANQAGKIGAWLADVVFSSFGYPGYMLPLALIGIGWYLSRFGLSALHWTDMGLRLLGSALLIVGASSLATLYFTGSTLLPGGSSGGFLGAVVADYLLPLVGVTGFTLLMLAVLCAGLSSCCGFSWLAVCEWTGARVLWMWSGFVRLARAGWKLGCAEVREQYEQWQRFNDRDTSYQWRTSPLPAAGPSADVTPSIGSGRDVVSGIDPDGKSTAGREPVRMAHGNRTSDDPAGPDSVVDGGQSAQVSNDETGLCRMRIKPAQEETPVQEEDATTWAAIPEVIRQDETGSRSERGEAGDDSSVPTLDPCPADIISQDISDWEVDLCIRTRGEEPDLPVTLSHIPEEPSFTEVSEEDQTDVPAVEDLTAPNESAGDVALSETGAESAPEIMPICEQDPGTEMDPLPDAHGSPGEEIALPELSLLQTPDETSVAYSGDELSRMSALVEQKLSDFGVECKVVEALPGPVITRFGLELGAGVKGSRVSTLARDLARALSVVSVRVVEIIPGKSILGLELPNKTRETVSLREIIASAAFQECKSPLPLALGKDISGVPVVAELDRMPHLLVAGTTGSGKSVSLNAMILSLLYRATPRQVRLIMIDPKMLELSIYRDIPHLLAPVVTDMKQAGNALRWCVAEMDRRYQLLAEVGVRNIAGYNRQLMQMRASYGEEREHLPYIVVIIDELADLMMVTGKKIEEQIVRLAQKARAAGIHLILATQRPSVDVITGLIKANVPTRISFQVSSRIDSRTILDQAGAEALLGQGDMLYLRPGNSVPARVHAAFVADDEVHRVSDHWRSLGGGSPDYMDDVVREYPADAKSISDGDGGEEDPLYPDAVRVVLDSRRASISFVQRRLKIGYNRAARLVEEMEKQSIVGPQEANGNREVLASGQPSVSP